MSSIGKFWDLIFLYTRNGSKNIQKSSATETSNAKQHGASCDGPAKSRRSHLISSRDQLVVPEENSHGSFRCLSEGGEKLSKTLKYNLDCKRYRQIQCTWITDSCSLWILKYQSWTFLNCPIRCWHNKFESIPSSHIKPIHVWYVIIS